MVNEVFAIFDVDSNQYIDREDALKHWKTAFGKISAKEFLTQLDMDKDGKVSYKEFYDYWKAVKSVGHSEEEILEELDNLKNG